MGQNPKCCETKPSFILHEYLRVNYIDKKHLFLGSCHGTNIYTTQA